MSLLNFICLPAVTAAAADAGTAHMDLRKGGLNKIIKYGLAKFVET